MFACHSQSDGAFAGRDPFAFSSFSRHARVAVSLVPVEQLIARSGVEKWNPDVSCNGSRGPEAPCRYCELSARGASETMRPMLQSGNSVAVTEMLGSLVLVLGSDDSVVR